ncbi:POP1 [[Candida] subhashii]|uniref:POP1 n=1 Tax=[Candida] subhashii TaxID=561895 RepID=A0A8J5QJU4_9ASCO|nr:POP1 [[Candida] subhashii]KAG7663463.1 POP1 [[Candida] subhashii]
MSGKPNANINKKKTRLYNSRTIKTQIHDSSFENKEKLNVANFLQARKFEIKSFELSQLNSKNASSTRVFQSLPRSLRRRAASHNVKRIPKRLRLRARREMSTNGGPVKKLPKGRHIYKLLASRRLLKVAGKLKAERAVLPDMKAFQAKLNLRAQYKLLSKQLKEVYESGHDRAKLNNSVGARDITGLNQLADRPMGNIKYRKRQKEFVWTPTHIWHAKRFKMMKLHGYQIPYTPTQKCFKSMNRQYKAKAVAFDTSYYCSLILNIDQEELFDEVLRRLTNKSSVSKKIKQGEKSYNDWIYIDSKQLCKGFIYANLETNSILVRVFPSVYTRLFTALQTKLEDFPTCSIHDCRFSLGSIELSGPMALSSLSKVFHFSEKLPPAILDIWGSLANIKDSGLVPIGTTFTFHIQDPRVWKRPSKFPYSLKESKSIYDIIISLSSSSSPQMISPKVIEDLFTPEGRYTSYKDQLTLKEIGRFYGNLNKQPSDISHSQIPILVSKTASQTWTVITPWYWVLPVWSRLVHVRDVKPGGIQQVYQFNFENGLASFPQDYPWLYDGWVSNDVVEQANKLKDGRLPRSQVTIEAAEGKVSTVFRAHSCDWHSLRNLHHLVKYSGLSDEKLFSRTAQFAEFLEDLERKLKTGHDVIQVARSLYKEVADPKDPVVEIYDSKNVQHVAFFNNDPTSRCENVATIVQTKIPVIQISLTLVNDGTISNNARIYINEHNSMKNHTLPSDFNMIGFVTTGGMNLNRGKCTGIATIVASKQHLDEKKIYIRNVGTTKLYLAEYKVIS